MSPRPRVVYSPRYNIRFWGLERLHPFDSCKYGRAWKQLRDEGVVGPGSWLQPAAPAGDELLLVHTPEYLASLKHSRVLASALEVPLLAWLPNWLVDAHVLRPMRWATAGTLLAAREALTGGMAINLSGGYHHASRDRGEGFCVYADVAVAVAALRRDGRAAQVLVIDLDAHQGNGLERIFLGDPGVHIFDMYNQDIYPHDEEARRAIRWEVRLRSGADDAEYLGRLQERLPTALDNGRLDIAFYNAGTDIYRGDPLGRLAVSEEGVLARDRFVFEELTGRGIPWVMVLSGGYTRDSYRLVANAVRVVFQRWGTRP